MNIFKKLLIRFTLYRDKLREDACSEESLHVKNGYNDVNILLVTRDNKSVIITGPPGERERILKRADKWRRARGLKSVWDLTEEDILDWNVEKLLQPIDLNKHTTWRRQSTFLGIDYRFRFKEILAKSPSDVLTSDEVFSLFKKLRPEYHLYAHDVTDMRQANRIIFLHHLAMLMSLDNYEERRSSDLALIESEYIGLCCTVNYVQQRFPSTPVKQMLLDYINERIAEWYEWDGKSLHHGRKPYYITWEDGRPFTEWSDVCDAFSKAYTKAQTDFPSYIVTILPSYSDLSVHGWDDTYADVKRCMCGYLNNDEIYTKAGELTHKRAANIRVRDRLQELFFQAVLDGKFDDVYACMRFYKTNAAGILLSYELGVLPFDLDKTVLWYLKQEVMHDGRFNSRLSEYAHAMGEWHGNMCGGELPYSLDYRMRSGQGTAPLCVRLMKGWRYADNELHNLQAMTEFDGNEYKHFHLECEILEDGVKGSIVERTHQVVLYTVMTDDEHGKHVWDVWENEEGLTHAAKWYRTDRTEFGQWLWSTLSMFNGLSLQKAVREWKDRNK